MVWPFPMGYRKKIPRESPPGPPGASFQKGDPSNVGEAAAQLSLNLSTPSPPKIFPPENGISSKPLISTPIEITKWEDQEKEMIRRVKKESAHEDQLLKDAKALSYNFSSCITRENSVLPPYKYFLPDVIAAIKFTGGNLHEISLLLNRTRTSVRDFIFANIETQAALEEEKEIQLDKVEKKLFQTALELGDPATLRFICSTLARSRGYTPEVKVGNSSEGPLQFELVLQKEQSVLQPVGSNDSEKKIDDFLKGRDEP